MELSNEKYMENINRFCDIASNPNTIIDVVEPMPMVPGIENLRESGNYLYIENNKLLCTNPRHNAKVLRYLEERGLNNRNDKVEDNLAVNETVSEELAVEQNVVC